MATLGLIDDAAAEADPRVRAVFSEIRATRGSDRVNHFRRGLANDPALLERIWAGLRAVMAPGTLDPRIEEPVYAAVSIANGRPCCIHSHTAAARAEGLIEARHGEFLAVVGTANQTDALVTGMRLPIDPEFQVAAR